MARLRKAKDSGTREEVGFDALRYALYEHCVQNVSMTLRIIEAIWNCQVLRDGSKASSLRIATKVKQARNMMPRRAKLLAEDFCGSALLARGWCLADPKRRAVATDIDAVVLAHSKPHRRLTLIQADVCGKDPEQAAAKALGAKADVVQVGNFSIGELHERSELTAYLKQVRGRVADDGLFVCDMYAGPGAWKRCKASVDHPAIELDTARLEVGRLGRLGGLKHARVRYTWRQIEADLATGLVHNAIDFALLNRSGSEVWSLKNAFKYNWRLWSIAELRDALHDAGFSRIEVYGDSPDAMDAKGDAYVTPLEVLETRTSAVVYVAARP